MDSCYIPPPYRPRLFPRVVRWGLIGIACVGAVVLMIFLSWVGDALYHGPVAH